MRISSYKDLFVWQKSMILAKEVFLLTDHFPPTEVYGLVSQMKRSAVAIPSNIAEGYGRNSTKSYIQFCSIAYGSALELETQLILSNGLGFVVDAEYTRVADSLTEICKMLGINKKTKIGK